MMLCVPSRRWKAARLVGCSCRAAISTSPPKRGCAASVAGQSMFEAGRWSGFASSRKSTTASYHVSSSGGVFQAAMATPRGRSTRANSSSARSTSNQWKACPAHAASALAGSSGSDSAVPSRTVTAGSSRRSTARSAASGSTATSVPASSTSVRVSLPVPAATSTASGRSGRSNCSNAMAKASRGQPGRVAS